MGPVGAAAAAEGIAKLIDLAFTLAEAGLARGPVVEMVQAKEAAGATPEQISEALEEMRKQAETDADAAVEGLKPV